MNKKKVEQLKKRSNNDVNSILHLNMHTNNVIDNTQLLDQWKRVGELKGQEGDMDVQKEMQEAEKFLSANRNVSVGLNASNASNLSNGSNSSLGAVGSVNVMNALNSPNQNELIQNAQK